MHEGCSDSEMPMLTPSSEILQELLPYIPLINPPGWQVRQKLVMR